MTKPVLHVLTGPTAVGKTEWALRWAEARGAEIVSWDWLLFYRGMNHGPGKPTAGRPGVFMAVGAGGLARKNRRLGATLSEVRGAKDKAGHAMQIAQQKTNEAVQAKTQLQQALAEKTARIKELEAERKKIVTKLKE